MKKIISILVMSGIFLFSPCSLAFEFPRHSFEIGPEVSYIEYREPYVMKEEGIMYGVDISYAYHNNIMLRIEGRYSYGQVNYENSGTIDNINDYIIEGRGLVGYDFKAFKTFITPYIGLGYRYLNDDTAGRISSTGARGYERESNYYYSPIGFKTLSDIGNGRSWGITAEFDYFWKGQQKSHLSDAFSNLNNLKNDQKDGYGFRGSIRFQKKWDTMSFIFEPFVRFWYINKSEDQNVTYSGLIIGYGYEPKNESIETGALFLLFF